MKKLIFIALIIILSSCATTKRVYVRENGVLRTEVVRDDKTGCFQLFLILGGIASGTFPFNLLLINLATSVNTDDKITEYYKHIKKRK